VRASRLSAAARALGSATPATRTAAVWNKAVALFPPASSAAATPASIAAAFPTALGGGAALGKRPIVPRTVPREAVVDAVRGAPIRSLRSVPKTVVKSTSAFACFGTNRLSANRPGALSRLVFSRKGAKIICSPG